MTRSRVRVRSSSTLDRSPMSPITRGFRGPDEVNGYHDYGDPWREQRYQGD